MAISRLKITKIWTDVDFFEVNLELKGNDCTINLDIYLERMFR